MTTRLPWLATLALLLAGAAGAQDAPLAQAPSTATPTGADASLAVPVTGSRIERLDPVTASPVTVVSKEQIQASGKVSLGEFLQTLPEQGNTVNAQVNNGNDGSVRINLRSLGSNRTLVLVNGRRFVTGGTGADASVDLNTIPAAAVERIEILKDGASAVYGSDAIAGVVNVITKKRFSGTEVTAYAGQSSRGDATTYDVAATTGTGSEKGNLLFSLGFQKQKPIYAGDRTWSEKTYRYDFSTGEVVSVTGNSGTTPDGRFSLPSGACAAAVKTQALTDLCNLPPNPSLPASGQNQFIPNGDGTFRRASELYNIYPTYYLLTPNQRLQVYSTGDANLGSVARAFYEASYVNRTSEQNMAPMPVVMNAATGNPISKDSIYNPFGVDIVSWRKRTLEFGNRSWTQDLDTFRIVVGLDGALGDWAGPLRGWNWEASYSYGRTAGTEQNDGLLFSNRIGTAVGPSFQHPVQGPVCGDRGADGVAGTADDHIIPGCVPMNALGGRGTLTPAMKNYLGFQGVLRGYSQLEVASASLRGELLRLRSDRPAALSVGGEYHRDAGLRLPDPVSVAGESTGEQEQPTQGAYDALEGYAELVLPIVSGAAGVHDLELSLAARAFHYSTFGGDSTWQVGLRYAPVQDLVLRGTYATAFRAPSIAELYPSGTSVSYDFVPFGDPCADAITAPPTCGSAAGNGDTGVMWPNYKTANLDLKPERAKVLTLGAVLRPRWVPDLSLTLSYFAVELTGTVSHRGSAVILDRCYHQGIVADCALVQRDASGLIVRIDDPLSNAGATSTAGFDVGARYALDTGSAGRFTFLLDGTFLRYYRQTPPDGPVLSGRGNYDLGLLPAFKGNGTVGWERGGLGAGVTGRYIHSYEECDSLVCSFDPVGKRQVKSYLTADMYVSYNFKSVAGKTGLSVGMQNLFDTQPPKVYTAYSFSTDPGYGYAGRFFFGRVTQAF